MCRFKSGIILKSKVIVAPGENDSHAELLESLGIKDDYIGATRTFVRAELVQKKGEWWVSPGEHPETWKFIVDQDEVPEWFDKEKHEEDFRGAVCLWWKEHVLVDRKIEELNSGYYRLKRCEVKKLCNDVKVLMDSSQVGKMLDSSRVGEMLGNSRVGEMLDSSRVGKMLDSSQVGKMRGNSRVGEMRGNSQVGKMLDSSRVGEMWGSSQVGKMRGNSQVGEMWGSSQVGEMWGSSQVGEMLRNSRVGEMLDSSQVGEMWGSSQVGKMRNNSTARDFKDYPAVKIIVPNNGHFEMVAFKQKE